MVGGDEIVGVIRRCQMIRRVQVPSACRLSVCCRASSASASAAVALGAGLLLAGRADAATLYQSFQQTFVISERYAADQQTILDPAIRKPTDRGFDVVEGSAVFYGSHRVALPGFDTALGTLQSVSLSIASERTWNVGFSAAYLPDKPGGSFFESGYRLRLDFDGVPFAGAATHQPLACSASTVAGPCVNGYKEIANLAYAAALDPAAFMGPSAGVDLGYALISSWDGYVIGAPITSLLNEFSWAGTVDVTYGYAAVPEPATWAIVLLGFAGIGQAIRGRRCSRDTIP